MTVVININHVMIMKVSISPMHTHSSKVLPENQKRFIE